MKPAMSKCPSEELLSLRVARLSAAISARYSKMSQRAFSDDESTSSVHEIDSHSDDNDEGEAGASPIKLSVSTPKGSVTTTPGIEIDDSAPVRFVQSGLSGSVFATTINGIPRALKVESPPKEGTNSQYLDWLCNKTTEIALVAPFWTSSPFVNAHKPRALRGTECADLAKGKRRYHSDAARRLDEGRLRVVTEMPLASCDVFNGFPRLVSQHFHGDVVRATRTLVAHVLLALHEMHQLHVAHGDIKAENILVFERTRTVHGHKLERSQLSTVKLPLSDDEVPSKPSREIIGDIDWEEDERLRFVLADFDMVVGRCNQLERSRLRRCGTPFYIAPEVALLSRTEHVQSWESLAQRELRVDERASDVWAVGMLAIEQAMPSEDFTAFSTLMNRWEDAVQNAFSVRTKPATAAEAHEEHYRAVMVQLEKELRDIRDTVILDFVPRLRNADLRDFVSKTLKFDFDQRATVAKLLSHSFVKSEITRAMPNLNSDEARQAAFARRRQLRDTWDRISSLRQELEDLARDGHDKNCAQRISIMEKGLVRLCDSCPELCSIEACRPSIKRSLKQRMQRGLGSLFRRRRRASDVDAHTPVPLPNENGDASPSQSALGRFSRILKRPQHAPKSPKSPFPLCCEPASASVRQAPKSPS
ncbi:MAG: hypothetical protein MHM6MM_001158 [Cercozoa sp. M6MM]